MYADRELLYPISSWLPFVNTDVKNENETKTTPRKPTPAAGVASYTSFWTDRALPKLRQLSAQKRYKFIICMKHVLQN